MSDTMRIPRPLFCRRLNDLGGRSRLDPNGAEVVIKTRFADTFELPQLAAFEIGTQASPTTGSSAHT